MKAAQMDKSGRAIANAEVKKAGGVEKLAGTGLKMRALTGKKSRRLEVVARRML